jgi:hypothetical protein
MTAAALVPGAQAMAARRRQPEQITFRTQLVKFNLAQDFPVGLDTLWPVYGSPPYLEAKYRTLGAHRIDIKEALTDEQAIFVVLERTIAPDLKGVPDWARKLVGRDYVMRHENRCRRLTASTSSVSLSITPLGSPVTIKAVGSLNEVATGQCRLALEFDVGCSLPLVGKKVAELFAGKIREALQEDHDFTLEYIRQHG